MQATAEKPDMAKGAKYLVCVDARTESRVALRLACLKARARSSAVSVLHVIPPADFQTLGAIADRMREERHNEGDRLLKTLAEEARTAYGVVPSLVLREGPTGDEILAAALEDPHINMIVIGIAQQSLRPRDIGVMAGRAARWKITYSAAEWCRGI